MSFHPPCRLTAQVFTATLLISTIACSVQNGSLPSVKSGAAEATEPTIFNCVEQEGDWVTVPQRGNATSTQPLMTWGTREFGDKYTPKQRCQIVSRKLTDVVGNNGGRLKGLALTTGKLDNGYTVVCVVMEGKETCNQDNFLFTLNRDNAKNPGVVLAKINNFADGKAGDNKIEESGELPEVVSLENLVTRLLPEGNGF